MAHRLILTFLFLQDISASCNHPLHIFSLLSSTVISLYCLNIYMSFSS
nr:MAG TPA: hypothetical protein [Caudoviricetes sp.]